jgi:hypothetical protein
MAGGLKDASRELLLGFMIVRMGDRAYEAGSLYHKLERVIVPMFYSGGCICARNARRYCGQWFVSIRITVSQYLDTPGSAMKSGAGGKQSA